MRSALLLLLTGSLQLALAAERIPGAIPELRRTQRLQPTRKAEEMPSGFGSISEAWQRSHMLREHPGGKFLRISRKMTPEQLTVAGNPEGLAVGTIVHAWQGHTYGVISPAGVPVSMVEGETPFFEVPATALEVLHPEEEEALLKWQRELGGPKPGHGIERVEL
eukprot:TRINITY_DN17585_c0_g1_i4.p2 TRINITY_DN17585_c0_g1~~TRINITY_DN17585_c0_g1_i4.p2  ORF type:complete len:164 (+),score=38.35 TRINITY_DN17585_c0_g1_i4:249-740(+)